MARVFIGIMALLCISLLLRLNNFSREDNMVQLAIDTVRFQADLPDDAEVRLVEKRESSIPDFYTVKLLVTRGNQEFPIVVYVDRAADKVIVGSLFIKGENITEREAEESSVTKMNAEHLQPGKASLKY